MSPTDWQPRVYEQFDDERLRPALDLLARVPLDQASEIVDLGCGAGATLTPLRRRFPGAELLALDHSAAMLAAARDRLAKEVRGEADAAASVRFEQRDLVDWVQDATADPKRFDLVFSNAVLHWVPDHERLLPELFGRARPGGVLALQMPTNWSAPSHALMRRVLPTLEQIPEIVALQGRLATPPVAEPSDYVRWLTPHASALDLWETTYWHRLEPPPSPDGADGVPEHAVLAWTRSTALRPIFEGLDRHPRLLARFLERYGELLRDAYPPESDGSTLFPFRRLFVIATRG